MKSAKPLFCFDIDGTLFRWQLILCVLDRLATDYPHIAGLLKETTSSLVGYKNRQVPFEDFTQAYVEHFWHQENYVGIRVEDVVRVAKAIAQQEGDRVYVITRELLRTAKELGWATLAISGSPQEAVEEFLRPFEVDGVIAVTHPVDSDGRYAPGTINHPVHDKGAALQRFLDQHPEEIDLAQSVAIGDSLADASMLKRVGWPICFNPNHALNQMARQHGWPILIELRNIHFAMKHRPPSSSGDAMSLGEILPKAMGDGIQERLKGLGIVGLHYPAFA